MIDAFGRHRLLSFDRDPITRTPTVEIAHEALLREWPRLRAWIDDDRDGLRVLRHLGESATAWDRLDRDAGELYRGVRLDHALAWADDHGDDLTALEASFLATSAEQRDADRQAERERAAQRVRQNRRLRIALAVVALALAGAIAGAIIALDQRGNANETAFASETRRLVAGSASNVADDRRLALLLAAEVHRRDPSVESLGALQRALVATPSFVGSLGSGSGYGEVAFSADGAMLTAFTRQGVEVFDLETRAPVGQIIETDLEVVRGSLSRDGRVAALLDTNGAVHVYDVAGGLATKMTVEPNDQAVTEVALSWDGQLLALGRQRGILSVYRSDSLELEQEITAHADDSLISHTEFNADASLIATAPATLIFGDPEFDYDVRIWDLENGTQIGPDLDPNVGEHETLGSVGVEFAADGSAVTIAGVWNLRSWAIPSFEELGTVLTPGVGDYAADRIRGFTLLGAQRAAAALPGGRTVLFDLTEGATVDTRLDPQTGVAAVFELTTPELFAVSPDQSLLAYAGESGITLWSLDGDQPLARTLPRNGAVAATPLARTGRLLTNTGAWDISVDPAVPIADEALCPQVCPWWFESGWCSGSDETIVDPMGPPGSVPGDYTVFELVSVEPTGVVLADVPPAGPGAVNDAQGLYAAASFGTLPVYDLTTGELVFQTDDLAGDGLFPSALAFSVDGTRLVAGAGGPRALVWDTQSWEQVDEIRAETGGTITHAYFSPDGRYLMTADNEGTMTFRDAQSYEALGAPLIGLQGALAAFGAYFQSGGRLLLTYGTDGSKLLWDIDARARIGTSFPGDEGTPLDAGPDFRYVATLLGDHILLWNLNTEEWYDIACRTTGRNMTRAEWEEFGPADTEYRATCPQFQLEPAAGS